MHSSIHRTDQELAKDFCLLLMVPEYVRSRPTVSVICHGQVLPCCPPQGVNAQLVYSINDSSITAHDVHNNAVPRPGDFTIEEDTGFIHKDVDLSTLETLRNYYFMVSCCRWLPQDMRKMALWSMYI